MEMKVKNYGQIICQFSVAKSLLADENRNLKIKIAQIFNNCFMNEYCFWY